MKSIAIVTGATSGVGREFCRQLDGTYYGRIDEIWAIGRDEDALAEVRRALYAPVRTFALDLRDPHSFGVLRSALAAEEDACVSWLVNSAGFGWFGLETQADPSLMVDMVRVNCLAVVETIGLALPYVQPGSRIVNMSSVAAFLPLPGMGMYAATKRFVLDVTRVLNDELEGTGVHACAVCPKALNTGFWKDAGQAASMGKMLGEESVYDVVRKAIDAVEAGRGRVITSPDMHVVNVAMKLLPYGLTSAIGKAALHASIRASEAQEEAERGGATYAAPEVGERA
ncbi:MAG: SDR family NAD(P)-dependent oxidoreductase [Coriobacteriales bacterium]|jgi:short-subunit dehydrogenase